MLFFVSRRLFFGKTKSDKLAALSFKIVSFFSTFLGVFLISVFFCLTSIIGFLLGVIISVCFRSRSIFLKTDGLFFGKIKLFSDKTFENTKKNKKND